MEVQGRRSQENGPKAEKDQTVKSNRTRQKNKRRDIEKWDQIDSPGIPDRGETSELPRPPFHKLVDIPRNKQTYTEMKE